MKRLRDYSDTLQGAISIATNEQNLRARVNLSISFHSPYKSERREEPCIIKIGKNEFRSLVDIRAEVSSMHRRVYNSLKVKPKLQHKKINFR